MFEVFREKMSNILTVVGWTKAFLKVSLWNVRKVVSILTLKKQCCKHKWLLISLP